MLPPFIIDQIRRREEEEEQGEMPVLELPVPLPEAPHDRPRGSEDEPDRGIVIIDLG